MSKLIRGRITFSNVVALLALFFALGGSVYAAQKFSGKLVKSNSLPGNRIKKNSLTNKQIKEPTLKGVGSATALSRVTYQTASGTLDPAATSALSLTATCPPPQKAIGGGATVGRTADSFVNDATLTSDHSGFVAHAFTFGATTDTLTVTAVCVPVSATTP